MYTKHCRHYGITGELLSKNRGTVQFPDGTTYQHMIDGFLRLLSLDLNRPVVLRSITTQMRVNKEVRLVNYDENKSLSSRFFQVRCGKEVPLETVIVEKPVITKLFLQGFDAQLTYDEVIFVNVTVCAHNCRDVNGCFGDCRLIDKDFGCQECKCPEGSPANGCGGLTETEMNHLTTIRKGDATCRDTVAYKRMIDPKLDLDECIAYTYPKCGTTNVLLPILPKSRLQCLKYCY
uniref:Uncharacterized protein n=1 Tax=Romanomermis culicivorax TaxID=13658 RepID=A0A915IJ31_ROMCU